MTHESPTTRVSLLLRLTEPADQQAWFDFVTLYEPVIVRMAMKRGLQLSDAQDLCQEVLTRVSRAISQWQPGVEYGSFRGWLARVTRNLVIDHFRQRQRQPFAGGEVDLSRVPAEAADETFDHEARQQMFVWAAERSRARFSESSWQAFWLTAVERRGPRDVAQLLGLSVGAVYIARSRVLAHLRSQVQDVTREFSSAGEAP